VHGRGVSKSVHRPSLGWAAAGCYIVLCLIALFLLIGNGDDDGDGLAISAAFASFPWTLLIGWTLLALRRTNNLFAQHPIPSEWWELLQNSMLVASFVLNCTIAYQLGKRLPVI